MEKLETVLLILSILFIAVCIGGTKKPKRNEKLLNNMNKLENKNEN